MNVALFATETFFRIPFNAMVYTKKRCWCINLFLRIQITTSIVFCEIIALHIISLSRKRFLGKRSQKTKTLSVSFSRCFITSFLKLTFFYKNKKNFACSRKKYISYHFLFLGIANWGNKIFWTETGDELKYTQNCCSTLYIFKFSIHNIHNSLAMLNHAKYFIRLACKF